MGKRRASTRGQAREPASVKPYKVFVSHATADKWIAERLCDQIKATGAEFFRDDRDINGGDVIPDEIHKGIRSSRELVVLQTPESCHRDWVVFEGGAAWGRRKGYRIISILCHVTIDRIPDMLRDEKAYSLNEVGKYLDELAERVRGRHG